MKLNGYPNRAEYNRNCFRNWMETVSGLSDCPI
jgi:hypothetical protein